MPVTATQQAPSTAERVRSVCMGATGAMLAVDGVAPVDTPVHHLLGDGAFAVAARTDSELVAAVSGADGLEAVLELTDYAPIPLRRPVRSLVWIRGRLRRIPAPLVAALLDVIATDDPNPALLQVNSLRGGLSLMLSTFSATCHSRSAPMKFSPSSVPPAAARARFCRLPAA